MPAYIPLSGFIAHGFMRRARRRRSMAPILINWSTYEPAPGLGMILLDTKTIQLQNNVDMVQSVKWDNPIGGAVWLQSDSGDVVKIPPYSSGTAPILVGQGDSITAQLDPAIQTPPPSWNTLLTLLSVPGQRSTDDTASSAITFANSGTYGHAMGSFNPGLGGFVVTYAFHNISLSNAGTVLFTLPLQGTNPAGITGLCGAATIIGYDLGLIPSGFAAATNVELQLFFAQMAAGSAPLYIELAVPTGTPAPQQFFSAHGKGYTGIFQQGGSGPSVGAVLSASIGAATLTMSGSVDMLLAP